MDEEKRKKQVFQFICPCCQSVLWADPITQQVIQFKKGGAKKKESLEELLEKEKKRKSEFERKFEATAELGKKKKKKAEEGFKKALTEFEKED
ncbi:MAG: hypothetical protein GTO16_12805 [Candidatus Aminicenantes bacterium]|nr:hypothetical protein [Candidatus Aminicenantes bacterium]